MTTYYCSSEERHDMNDKREISNEVSERRFWLEDVSHEVAGWLDDHESFSEDADGVLIETLEDIMANLDMVVATLELVEVLIEEAVENGA